MPEHHAYWKGYLKLSLLTFGVRLFAATSEERMVRLHQLDRRSGKRIHYDKVVEGGGKVAAKDIVKAYEYEKGQYVRIEPDDIDQLKLESTDTLTIAEFVDEDALDFFWIEKPYYLLPEGKVSEAAYAVLRAAMSKTGKIGVGQLVIASHERTVALHAEQGGIVVYTLRPAQQVRKPEEFFGELSRAKPAQDEVDLTCELIKRKTADFDPARYVDHYEEALRELVQAKVAGTFKKGAKPREAATPGNVINLVDLLRESLAGDPDPKSRGAAARKTAPSGKTAKATKPATRARPSA